MQNQNPSNTEKTYFKSRKISFKQSIKKIQLSALKSAHQKKKIDSIKNRLKQEWLDRIKIISPLISPTDRQNLFRVTDFFARSSPFKRFKHECFKKDQQFYSLDHFYQNRPSQLIGSMDEITKKQGADRKSCEGSIKRLQRKKIDDLRQRKFKNNWKHSYRKDQMNVLKYSTCSPIEARIYKTGDICKMLQTLIEVDDNKQKNEDAGYKISITGKELMLLDENKENLGLKKKQNRQDKNYRVNIQKRKISLLINKKLMS